MIDLLMRKPPVILQDVIVLGARRGGQLLHNGQNLNELVVRDVGQFGAMVFRDHELSLRLEIALLGMFSSCKQMRVHCAFLPLLLPSFGRLDAELGGKWRNFQKA